MDRPFPARSWTLYYGAITNALVIFPLFYLIVQVHTYLLLPRFEVKLQDTNSLSRCTCVYGYITLIKHWLNLFLVNILDPYSRFQIKRSIYYTGWPRHLVGGPGYPWICLDRSSTAGQCFQDKGEEEWLNVRSWECFKNIFVWRWNKSERDPEIITYTALHVRNP